MKILSIIWKELLHRKMNAGLSILAVITAVGFFVAFFTTGEASKRETARIMRDIGYNIRIIHKDTEMSQFWASGYSELTMPEDYVNRFATVEGFAYSHLLATLMKRIEWNGMQVLLRGFSTEVAPPDHKKPSMIFKINEGKVYLGSEIVKHHGLKRGDEIEIDGHKFLVHQTLQETGTEDDMTIFTFLSDSQKVLNLPGVVNEIKALDCACLIQDIDPVAYLREQLEQIMPEAKMIHVRNIASARENQRQMMEKYFAYLIPLVTIVCAVWIGALAMMNTRERRQEIGIMRSLGYGSGTISGMFIGKAILIGVIGAVAGFGVGTWLSLSFGPGIFEITAKNIKPLYHLLGWSVVLAPIFAALSSFIPAVVAVTQDPADTLREM